MVGQRRRRPERSTRSRRSQLPRPTRQLEAALRENAGLHEQLLAQAREAGILEERQRLAREIHDTLAQGLTGIVTQLEAAEQAPAAASGHLDAAAQLARESLNEARRSVQALRPQPLEGARLPEALAEVASGWSELHGVAAAFSTTGDAAPAAPERRGDAAAHRPGGADQRGQARRPSRVGLTLSYMDDLVTLDVRDDGVGRRRRPPAAASG